MSIQSKKMLFLVVIFILIGTSASLMASNVQFPIIVQESGYASKAGVYDRPDSAPPYTASTRDIGHLEGSWYEMGVQYGERAGDLIAAVWDGWHRLFIPQRGIDYTYTCIRLYEEQMKLWAPQFLDFMQGMADGAAPWLDQSVHAADLSNFDKIFYITLETTMIRRHPPAERFPVIAEDVDCEECIDDCIAEDTPVDCCGGCSVIAIVGNEWDTVDGSSIFAHNCDCPAYPHLYSVAFTATPAEEGAYTFWSHSPAGCIMGLQATNEKGLTVSHNTGPGGRAGSIWFAENGYPDQDFGVPWRARILYSVVYSDTVAEAIKINTLGHDAYREATGRATLKRDGGSITTFIDGENVAIAEITASHYSLRYPGDYGELGNYVSAANHFICTNSFDSDNNYMPNRGMDVFQDIPTSGSSYQRHWTVFHLLNNNRGNITTTMVKEFMASHFYIDSSGRRIDYVWDEKGGWISAHYHGGTVCQHRHAYPENYLSGTMATRVVTLKEDAIIIEWTKGQPCHWVGPWDVRVMQ